MGAIFGRPRSRSVTLADVGVDARETGRGTATATPDRALRFSAVWAALRLRSDLISTLPVDVFRKSPDGRTMLPAPASRLFRRPADGILWPEWMASTQMDLDRFGNCAGHIEAKENGYPVQIEPWSMDDLTIRFKGRRIVKYIYDRTEYDPSEVWHERQYTIAGYRVGLSPLAYGAWAIGAALSAQDFSADWFLNGAHPSGVLKHTELANLPSAVIAGAKEKFKVAVQNRDIFATGKEWEFTPAEVDANSSQFLEAMGAAAVDVARYIGVPAVAIDAAVTGQALTYANVSQNQLSLLVNYLGAPIVRREWAFTMNALPAPRFAKFNSDALLRLDPAGRTDNMVKQIDAWLMDPDEGRALLNSPPLTQEQIDLLMLRQTKLSTADDDGKDTP